MRLYDMTFSILHCAGVEAIWMSEGYGWIGRNGIRIPKC
jgi:hypothetical protein